MLEPRYVPFKKDSASFSGPLDRFSRKASRIDTKSSSESYSGAGLLSVTVYGAEDVEGSRHNNPYALIIFRGEKRKSKVSNVAWFLPSFHLFALEIKSFDDANTKSM